MKLHHKIAAWLAGCLIASSALAQSGYKLIARFTEGRVADLGISIEYKPDKSRSVDVRFNRNPYGSTLFFHAEEWKKFSDRLQQVKNAPDGVEQKFADLPTPGGSPLRMSSIKHGSEIQLTIARQPDKGDSYPAMPFHLPPPDFNDFLKAVADTATALDKK